MQNNLFQVAVAALIVILLVSLSDPFMLIMPTPMAMMALLAATVLVCLFGGFVLREKPADEREALHRLLAGRLAYLAGLGTLTLGLIVEGLQHHVDPWIASALGIMIVVKLATRIFHEAR